MLKGRLGRPGMEGPGEGEAALALEPWDQRQPVMRPVGEAVFAVLHLEQRPVAGVRGLARQVVWVGLLMGLLSLGAGYWYWRRGDSKWQTILFTALTLSQMANVMAIRSERRSMFQIGLMSNKTLLGAVSLTVLLQLALLYVPFLQAVFRTSPT